MSKEQLKKIGTLRNFLHPDETVVRQIEVPHKKKEKVKTDVLGHTETRVYRLKRTKGATTYYVDIPIVGVKKLKNIWMGIRIPFVIIAGILLGIGIMFLLEYLEVLDVIPSIGEIFPGISYDVIIAGVTLAVGIGLLVLGLQKFGYFMVNNEELSFPFKKKKIMTQVADFIRNLYFTKAWVLKGVPEKEEISES